MVRVIRMFKPEDYQRILAFYRQVDSEYFPKLSERAGGLEGHMIKIINSNGNFSLFEVDGALEGVAGFFPLDRKRSVVQFTFFTFSEKYKGTISVYRLARYLAENT